MKMFRRRCFVVVVSAVVCGLAGAPALAVPRTWHLDSLQFADGARATGSFDFDADTGQYSNVDIAILNPTMPPFHYRGALVGSLPDKNLAFVPSGGLSDYTGSRVLRISIFNGMDNAGGTREIDFFLAAEGICTNASCSNSNFDRQLVQGRFACSEAVLHGCPKDPRRRAFPRWG